MKPTILAIDNDQLVLGSLKTLFLDADIEVETANNGELGIALFKDQPKRFDLVMLDFEMKTKDGQGMNGDEVAARIKAIDSHARIVMVSCVDDKSIAEACLQAGAEKFIRKDSDASHLLSTISSMITSEGEPEQNETDLERSNDGAPVSEPVIIRLVDVQAPCFPV